MDELLLKNYDILNHIKNEYDKLVEENKSLKEKLNTKRDLNKECYARVIIKGNGGYFNFKRCNCQKVNENYCNKHLINLKDGDVRYVGSKYFPFHYQQYGNIKVLYDEKGWVKKMEELFPNIYFDGANILDLTKYDIFGNMIK